MKLYYFLHTKTGRCYLHVACRLANLSAVQTLVSQEGADVNIRNVEGETPLLWMLRRSTQPESSILPVAQLLCDHGADVNIGDKEGFTPLRCVMMEWSYTPESSLLPVVQLLCGHGADVSVCDQDGCDAVAVAERNGWVEVFKVLRRTSCVNVTSR